MNARGLARVGVAASILVPAELAAAPVAARSGYICYIERVVERGDGVSIAFNYAHQAEVAGARVGPWRRIAIGPGRRPLRLRPGEAAHIRNFHDGCVLNVAFNAGRIGLLVRNWSAERRAEYSEVMLFVPAERRR